MNNEMDPEKNESVYDDIETLLKEIQHLTSLKKEAYNALKLLDSNGLIDKRIFQGFDNLVKKLGDDK